MIAVKDLMTAIGSQASADDPLVDVVATMRRNNHSCVVVTSAGRVTGIITERDLIGLLANSFVGDDIRTMSVSTLMTPDPLCVAETASLLDALKLARSHRVRHLPVVDGDGQLVGMVTHTDMINIYVEILEEQALLIDANTALRAQSREDPLLQIGNRRAMEGDLLKVAAAAQRANQSYAIALFDIDYFKPYNDHYGHVEGDHALQAVVAAISQTMRHGDSLYRYGGEELLLLMPNSDLAGAQFAAERARYAVEKLELRHSHSPYNILTISGGLASDNRLALDQVIAAADKALYRAKAQGRNRISGSVHADPTGATTFEVRDT
jgi:diguanylate cyclase (GGDEF)-like protein